MMKIFLMMFMLIFNLIFMNIEILMIFLSNILMLILIFFFIFFNNFNWFGLYSWLGMDFYGYLLSMLSILIISLMFLINVNFNKFNYSLLLLILLIFLLFSFMTLNYFLFYLFFEISLIPTFILIMGWGYQPERLNSSFYMLVYTLFASLPKFVILFYLYNYYFSFDYLFILNSYFLVGNYMIYLYMILAYLVKLPIFMFHIWLPKAHVEAPVSGSMILAGVMLKLGGYGLIRSLMIMLNLSKKFNIFIFMFSLLGMIYVSLVCLRQFDLKMLVAYSSVVHMGMMLIGLLTLYSSGFLGGLIMMVAHGFCSSGLFYLVNVFYERSKSRMIFLNKGLIYMFSSLMLLWFFFCVFNLSAPPSMNLVSEIMILSNLFNYSMNIFFYIMLAMYLSSIYSFYLFSIVMHGNFSMNLVKIFPVKVIEYLNLNIHLFPLMFITLNIFFMI